MKLSEEQYEVIEAYLTNELSSADRALFERDMQANSELKDEVNRQQAIRLGLRAMGIERALERSKTQYKALQSTPQSETSLRTLTNWRYWAVAASVILVLSISYYIYQQVANQQAGLAYSESFTPESTDELIKEFPSNNVTSETRNRFLEALTYYRVGDYDKVITKLKTLPAQKQAIVYKNYFLGLSYLANNQTLEAIPLLQKAQLTAPVKLHQKAEWFLALAYVKNGQKEKALPTLKRISTEQANPFRLLAKQVLLKID